MLLYNGAIKWRKKRRKLNKEGTKEGPSSPIGPTISVRPSPIRWLRLHSHGIYSAAPAANPNLGLAPLPPVLRRPRPHSQDPAPRLPPPSTFHLRSCPLLRRFQSPNPLKHGALSIPQIRRGSGHSSTASGGRRVTSRSASVPMPGRRGTRGLALPCASHHGSLWQQGKRQRRGAGDARLCRQEMLATQDLVGEQVSRSDLLLQQQ